MTVLKIDMDIKPPDDWLEDWKDTRRIMLNYYLGNRGGGVVKDIIVKPSSKRGFHAWIHIDADYLTDSEINRLQWLLGDDETRVMINQRRIDRGVPWKDANILFSRVLRRKEYKDERCEKCGLRTAIESLFGGD